MIEFLIWFIASFISTFGYAYVYFKYSDANNKINISIAIVFLIGAITLTLVKYFEIPFLSFTIFFLFYPFLFYLIRKMHFKKIIYYVLIIWFLGMIIDLLLMLLMSWFHYLFNFNVLKKWNLMTVILSFFVVLCLIIIANCKRLKMFVLNFYIRLSKIKYSDFLLIFLMLFTFISAFVILTSLPNLTIDILLSLLILLIFIVFIFLIKYKIDEEENEKYLKLLKDNNEFYIVVTDEYRLFKHNLVSKLLSIKSVANSKTILLLNELIKDFNDGSTFSNKIKIIPYGLNGIIYQKLNPYVNTISLEVFNEINYDVFDYLKPRRYNVLIEKLSIVLDNAIESCLKSRRKIISINIFEEDSSIIVEVKNTFSNVLDLDVLGNKNYSTKGKNRGLGLFSALRNFEVQLIVKIINNFFVSRLIVKKSELHK